MSETFSDDLLRELSPEIQEGCVQISEDFDSYAALLEARFPFLGASIQWEVLPDVISRRVEDVNSVDEHVRFLGDCLSVLQLKASTRITVLNDGAFDFAILLLAHRVVAVMQVILAYPHNVYLFDSDASWCIGFMTEGHNYLAFAPRAVGG